MTAGTECPSSSPSSAGDSAFRGWRDYFAANPARQRALEAAWDRDAPVRLTVGQRRAVVRSFQRFELGEGGDGERLLARARAAGDPVYAEALELLVAEEQRHSALFGVGLRRLAAPSLEAHWSDAAVRPMRTVGPERSAEDRRAERLSPVGPVTTFGDARRPSHMRRMSEKRLDFSRAAETGVGFGGRRRKDVRRCRVRTARGVRATTVRAVMAAVPKRA